MGGRSSKTKRRRRDGTPRRKHAEKATNDLKSSGAICSPSSAQNPQDFAKPSDIVEKKRDRKGAEEEKKKNGEDDEEHYIDEKEDARRRRAYREPSEIFPGLYVGTYSQSCDHAMLRRKGIRYLLCVKGSSRVPPREFEMHHAPLSDFGRTDLEDMFEEAFPFIQKAEAERAGILIFCSQGVNRAPTTAIGYLMFSRQWSLKKAYEYVQSKRPRASPHEKVKTLSSPRANPSSNLTLCAPPFSVFRAAHRLRVAPYG
uniref:protein-tyrosine-phosphatase n=1 Tax=Lotharella globosa TaxID=91324 RepID=A0A7S3YF42_9EUKA